MAERTLKLRIYPNRTQQKELVKMATGVDKAWNYLSEIQARRFKDLNPIKITERKYTDKKGKVVKKEKLCYDRGKKAPLAIPYKDVGKGSVLKERPNEQALIGWGSLSHFLRQYTDLGKFLYDAYSVQSSTAEKVCKQFETNYKEYVKKIQKLKQNDFYLKQRTKADWIPFRDGQLTLVEDRWFKLFGLTMKISTDKRNLRAIVEQEDPRIRSTRTDLKKAFRGGSIVRERNKWFLHVCINVEEIHNVEPTGEVLGIDPGFNTCFTASDGDLYKRPDLRKEEGEVRALQRKASKSKGGKVRKRPSPHILKKALRKDQKIHNKKREWERRTADQMTLKGKNIAVGDMNLRSMQRTRGSSVRREAIGSLKTFLSFKARERGLRYVEVSEKGTTLTCHNCGAESGPRGVHKLNIREWRCSECGMHHNRDVNAALNIQQKGVEALEQQRQKELQEKEDERIKGVVLAKQNLPETSLDVKVLRPGLKNKDFKAEVYIKGTKETPRKILKEYLINRVTETGVEVECVG
jgi:transposase